MWGFVGALWLGCQVKSDPLAVKLKAHQFRGSLRGALRILAKESKLGYAFSKNVVGNVDVRLNSQSLGSDLEALLKPLDYSYQIENNTLRVFNPRVTNQRPEGFEFHRADVGVAFTTLGALAKSRPIVAHEVTRKLTLRMSAKESAAPFEVLLTKILNPVRATYRYERGSFTIIPKGTRAYTIPYVMGDLMDTEVASFDVDKIGVQEVLKKLFNAHHVRFWVEKRANLPVTVHLKRVKFELLLQTILNQVHWTYRYEDGTIKVIDRSEFYDS